MDLSISIVAYNTEDLVKRCLLSIFKYTKGITFEVFVVDNGSKDKTVAMIKKEFPQVKLIANKENVFFARANNQALEKAKGQYFLILNSDTYFIDNSLKKMVDYMEKHADVGAVDGLEIYEDGHFMDSGSLFSTPLIDFFELSLIGKRIAPKKIINGYRIAGKDRKGTFPIDVGCDAFLMVRKNILDQIDGYDDKFLLYYTENDLCLRIKKIGKQIMHYGDAKVMHKVSASVNTLGWKKTDYYYKDLLWYYRKNGFPITGTALFCLLKFEEMLLKVRSAYKKKP